MAEQQGRKPYLTLSMGLVVSGAVLYSLEQFGLDKWGHNRPIDGTLLSLMILVPVGLVVAGCIVFIVGKMRKL